MREQKVRKRWRRKTLAEHFDVNIRTIDLWVKKKILPRPHYLKGSPIPFWYADQIPEGNQPEPAA